MKKTSLKNYLKTGLLGFTVPFLLWNCESENVDTLKEQQNTVETVSVDEAVDFFTAKTVSKSATSVGEDYVIPHLVHISQEEIINSDVLLTVIPAATKHENYYSRILLLKINNKIQSIIFSMNTSGKASPYFTGEILITDLQGGFLNGYRVENGQFIAQFRKKEEPGTTTTTAKTGNVVCPEHGECNGETDCILCLQELEEVEVTGEAGGSGDFIEVYPGLNDFPGIDEGGENGLDMGMGWDYGPGDGMAPEDENSCSEGYVKDNNGICVEEDKIIDELTGKEKCVNDLLDETGNSYVKDILSKFEGVSEFDIKIQSQDSVISEITGKGVNGITSPPENGLITIKISTDKALNRPVLDVARTILHEYIHADMFRKLHTKYPTDGDLDFKQTYEALAWLGLKEHDVQAYIALSGEEKAALENSLTMYYPSTTKNCPEN